MYFVEKHVPFQTADEMRVALRDAIMTEKNRRGWCADTDTVLDRCGLPGYVRAPFTAEIEAVLGRYKDIVCAWHGAHIKSNEEIWNRRWTPDHSRGDCVVNDIERNLRLGRRIFVPVTHASPSDYYRNGAQVSEMARDVYMLRSDPSHFVRYPQ